MAVGNVNAYRLSQQRFVAVGNVAIQDRSEGASQGHGLSAVGFLNTLVCSRSFGRFWSWLELEIVSYITTSGSYGRMGRHQMV